MNSSNTQANKELFQQAKEFYLTKEAINLAKTGSTSERLRYVLSTELVSVNTICTLCSIDRDSVIKFLFKYNHNLNIYTFKNKHNCYFFTTCLEIINHLKSLNK